MAVDKLVDSTQLDADLTSVANAIRTKGGTSSQLAFPNGFVYAVNAIPTSGGISAISLLDRTITEIDDATITTLGEYALAMCKNLTSCNLPNVSSISAYAFYGSSNLVKAFFPLCTILWQYAFQSCTNLVYAVFPSYITGTAQTGRIFGYCSKLKGVDFNKQYFLTNVFADCVVLDTVVLRRADDITTLSNINNFQNTPFASNGSGGTLYVPQALIESYQSATNWSTLLGYPNNQILKIEGSIYETQYVDGTPIT